MELKHGLFRCLLGYPARKCIRPIPQLSSRDPHKAEHYKLQITLGQSRLHMQGSLAGSFNYFQCNKQTEYNAVKDLTGCFICAVVPCLKSNHPKNNKNTSKTTNK